MVDQESIGKEMKEVIQSNKEYIQVEFEKVRNEMGSDQAAFAEEMKTDQAAFMDEMKKILGNVQAGVDEKINKLTEKVEVQTNEFISARDDVKEL